LKPTQRGRSSTTQRATANPSKRAGSATPRRKPSRPTGALGTTSDGNGRTARRASARIDVHVNLNVRGLGQSATVAINERCDVLRRQGKEVFKLGLGQSPFPVPRPVVEELQANAHQKAYLPTRGLDILRDAVAEYHRRTQGLACTPDQVLIGPGSKELMFLLMLTYYGDVVIPAPAWVSYAPQAHILGRAVRWIHTHASDGWRLTPGLLESSCHTDQDRPRIVVLNYPSNPTGGTYSVDELQELAACARKYRVVLLSDEIYGELHHKGQHVSVARFYPEGTIVSGGLSKWCGAGGWRLGTFAFPEHLEWLRDSMTAVASETFTSTSAPIQYAAVRAFRGGIRIERYLWQARKVLAALGTWTARRLTSAGVPTPRPSGAFYVFPDFEPLRDSLAARGIRTSRQLCQRLLEDTGVAILPGVEFGRPPEELTARIAYVDFDGARALAAAETLPRHEALDDAFLRAYCAPVLTALDRLCDWITR
jgi:aspartate aminotransferase